MTSMASSTTSLLSEHDDDPLVIPGDWASMSEFDRRKHALMNAWTTGNFIQAEAVLGSEAHDKAKSLCDRIETERDGNWEPPDSMSADEIAMQKKSRIVSFDLGEKNLAYTVWDPKSGFVEMSLRDISDWTTRNRNNRKVKCSPVDVVMRLQKEGVLEAGTILVERQMKSRFKCMQVALQTLKYENCVVVAPQSVKKHFNSGHGGGAGAHRKNKKKAVSLAKSLLTPEERQLMMVHRKLDDLADCVLQTVWWVREDIDPNYRVREGTL